MNERNTNTVNPIVRMIDYLNSHYAFRYNCITSCTEYRATASAAESFVPLDPRQGEHSADGLLYFLKNVNCDAVYPMHYWGEQDIIDKFTKQYPEYSSRIKSTESAKEEII